MLPGEEVLDDIIDAFITISKFEQNCFDPLIFPVATFLSIKENKSGIYNYAYKNNASTKKIWIIPKGGNHHWILLVIVFDIKSIINLDSLHGSLSTIELKELCSFIDTIYYGSNLESINWSEWTFYSPKDIPHQLRGKSQGNNCGIHLCLYIHIICTSTYIIFDENVMDIIRKWIFDKIYCSKNKNIKDISFHNIRKKKKYVKKIADVKNIKQSNDTISANFNTIKLLSSLKTLYL